MTFDLEKFNQTVEKIVKRAKKEKRLIENPSDEELRKIVEKEPGIRKTKYGNFVAYSEPTSRAAKFTKNSVDSKFGEEEIELLSQAEKILAKEKLILVDRIVGNENSQTTVRLIVPKKFAHIAWGGKNLYLPIKKKVEKPDYQVVFFADEQFEKNKSKPLPEKDITIRLAMLKDGRVIKIIRNSNYIGEYKKGVFAAQDWNTKTRKGGIFLHSGCREDYLRTKSGKYKKVRTLILALSANGKTTLTSQILAREGKEKSWIIQDDGGSLFPDGSFYGFEGNGLYVKTEGVNPGNQREVFYGLLKSGTFCENVFVEKDEDFDFYNIEITSNGRAVIQRKDFMSAAPYIDVDRVDNIILITRGPLIPAICKLTPEQAVALMIAGLAMESSAGDPTQAGKIRSEFFYDPFVAGDRAEHANRFYEIIKGLPHLNFYLMNTGGIGEGIRFKDITVEHSMTILDALLRGSLDGLKDWRNSPSGFKVPATLRGIDDIYFYPETLYSQAEFKEKQKQLNQIRIEAIEKIEGGLYPVIRKVFKA